MRACNREVTARSRVSRFEMEASRVRRMSAPEKRLKTSSADSGSSQNCSDVESAFPKVPQRSQISDRMTYSGPVGIIGCNVLLLGEPEDALLEDKLGLGGSHCWP